MRPYRAAFPPIASQSSPGSAIPAGTPYRSWISAANLSALTGIIWVATRNEARPTGPARRLTQRARGGAAATMASACFAALITPALYHRLYERLVYGKEYDGSQEFAMVVENKSGVITVAKSGSVYGGGSYEGVVNPWLEDNDKNGIHRAYTIGAIHAAPRNVLMVGLASGSWAQVVAHLDGVRDQRPKLNPNERCKPGPCFRPLAGKPRPPAPSSSRWGWPAAERAG